MPYWPDKTPTVWNMGNGVTIYINMTEAMRKALPADWLKRAADSNSFPIVATRQAATFRSSRSSASPA